MKRIPQWVGVSPIFKGYIIVNETIFAIPYLEHLLFHMPSPKNFIFLLLAALTIHARAQLAPVGTKWTIGLQNTQDPTLELKEIYTVVKDTLIGNYTYSFVGANEDPNDLRSNFWRQDSGRVYYNRKGTDYRFFDFNAKVGDTVTVDLTLSNWQLDSIIKDYKVKIKRLEYFKYNTSDSLKEYYFDRLDSNYVYHWLNSSGLLEKVMCFKGVNITFSPVLTFYIGESWSNFRCYEEPGGITINNNKGRPCETVSIDEISYRDKQITVYPNPAWADVFIQVNEFAEPIEKVDIYNQTPALVFTRHDIQEQTIAISLANYTAGVYDIIITFKDGIRITRKLSILSKTKSN